MIVKLSGKLVEKNDYSLIIDVNGLYYEVLVPLSVSQRLEDCLDENGDIQLLVYHYLQIGPSAAHPILIGFLNDIEKDFFLKFIKVSGIGPRAAVKAINKPISEISRAINNGDVNFLKTLKGIGLQKAKEIVAKLQGKIGKFGLIKDDGMVLKQTDTPTDLQQEALEVLMQLQYKKNEAQDMIKKALERSKDVKSSEELLNEIYKQRVSQ